MLVILPSPVVGRFFEMNGCELDYRLDLCYVPDSEDAAFIVLLRIEAYLCPRPSLQIPKKLSLRIFWRRNRPWFLQDAS
jgi:hypothetical protein